MNQIDPILISYFLGGIVLVLLIWIIVLELRLRKLLRGKSGSSLEGLINDINKAVDKMDKERKMTNSHLHNLHNKVRRSIQGVHTKRFNPFQGEGQGGNNSFATAFINADGDGVIISSLYSRGQVRTFAKPLKAYKSEHELTQEEIEVLEGAKNS